MRKLVERLPLPYRVLCRQFVLRVIDLESLSIQADIPRYLGQFGGVLLMLGFVHTLFVYVMVGPRPWFVEQYLVRTTMLVAGFVTVVCWDSMFPDRRDVMVLGTLPVKPATILLAKVSATASLVGLGMVCLNAGPGLMAPLMLGNGVGTMLRAGIAYWITMAAASLFLYGSVHTVQGVLALVLPRSLFLRVSSLLQLVAFTLFLAVFFLEPSVHGASDLLDPAMRRMVVWSPPFWFLAMFNGMNASLPQELRWLAWRGWIAVGAAMCGAASSLLLCYLRTMKKTVEQQDLAPVRRRARLARWDSVGGAGVAMLVFSMRALLRSRQHRAVYAFYLSLVLALGLSCLHEALSTPEPHAVPAAFFARTVLMLSLAVVGLRSVSSLPVSLHANWVMRVTQMGRVRPYLAAGRTTALLFAVLPVWLGAAGLAQLYRPRVAAMEHLPVLACVGWLLVEVSLLGASKAPFACSYLPGKSNVQARFWTFVIVMVPVATLWGIYERWLLVRRPMVFVASAAGLGLAAAMLWLWNRYKAASTVLEFEEQEPEDVVTLGLDGIRGRSFSAAAESNS